MALFQVIGMLSIAALDNVDSIGSPNTCGYEPRTSMTGIRYGGLASIRTFLNCG
jgi:hypothetical protein